MPVAALGLFELELIRQMAGKWAPFSNNIESSDPGMDIFPVLPNGLCVCVCVCVSQERWHGLPGTRAKNTCVKLSVCVRVSVR